MPKGKNSRNVESSTIWTKIAKAETQLKKIKSEFLAVLYAKKAELDLEPEKLYRKEFSAACIPPWALNGMNRL